jgi:stage II sporulation protein D
MIRLTTCLFLFLFPLFVNGQEISVRIFSKTKPSTFVFTPLDGAYKIITQNGDNIIVKQGETVVFSKYENRVLFRTLAGVKGLTDTVRVIPLKGENTFKIRQPANGELPKTLCGKVKVYIFPGSLMILNIVDIEAYLPGAVRAEAGRKGPLEYFRTQAIIARTYVYRHLNRHILDGYNMCDDVHCQVYSGLITEQPIIEACKSTAGMVLVDSDTALIISAFHANCGGETASSRDVWVMAEPYLIAVKDTFCTKYKPTLWQRKITLGDWKKFLISKGITVKDTLSMIPVTSGKTVRVHDYLILGIQVPASEIRNYFSLKSTFFTITKDDSNIIFTGRGYGHGVGLCQDGAMAMALEGMSYKDITRFYYPGTFITSIKNAHAPAMP